MQKTSAKQSQFPDGQEQTRAGKTRLAGRGNYAKQSQSVRLCRAGRGPRGKAVTVCFAPTLSQSYNCPSLVIAST